MHRTKALAESEAKYRDLVQSANSVIMRFDQQGMITFFNDYGLRFFGYSPGEIIGKPVIGTITPKMASSGKDLVALIESVINNTDDHSYNENENIKKNGELVWMAWSNKLVDTSQDSGYEILSVGTDITDRKRAEELLINEKKRAQEYLDIAGAIIIALDADHRVTLINRKGCSVLGRPEEEIVGKDWIDRFIDEREKESVRLTHDRLMNGQDEELSYFENHIITPDGRKRLISWHNSILKDEKGRVTGTLSSGQDITEKHRVELQIQHAKEEWERTFDSVPDLITVLDKDQRITRINRTAAEELGLSVQEAIGKYCYEIFHRGELPIADCPHLKVMHDGQPNSIEYWEESLQKHLHVTVNPIYDSQGKMIATVHVARDVTVQKKAQQLLRSQFNLLQTLIDTIPSPVFYKDVDGRYLGCNKAFKEFFRIGNTSIIGKRVHEIASKEMAEIYAGKDRELLQKPGTHFYEAEARFPDNAMHQMLHQKATFTNAEGELAGIVGIMTDVTEIRAMERRLLQARKLESIGQLAAGIAHEINTPTQFIHSNVEFIDAVFTDLVAAVDTFQKLLDALRDGQPVDDLVRISEESMDRLDMEFIRKEIPEALAGSLDGLSRISRIVNSMKYFSHPGKQDKVSVKAHDIIDNAVVVSRNEWKYCADTIVDIDPDLPPLPCYAAEFSQVLLNLIVNAAHAIAEAVGDNPAEKGKITIRATKDDDFIKILISDTGMGIPEEIRPRIFDLFFTTKDVGKGTGQGLSFAYSLIVDKHGGTIDFESAEGRGTTFIIRLPLNSE